MASIGEAEFEKGPLETGTSVSGISCFCRGVHEAFWHFDLAHIKELPS